MDSNKGLFRESPASGLEKLNKNFNISLDQALKEDCDPVIINCSDIKEKTTSQPIEIKKNKEEKTKNSGNLLEEILMEINQEWRKAYLDKCMGSKRTQEWCETSWEYKKSHPECEYCGEIPDKIETHDIKPYNQLDMGQRHDRDFLRDNLISLCIEHHRNVAHLGDPYSKFEPNIRDICEQKKQERYVKKQEISKPVGEKQKFGDKRTEDFRRYVKMLHGNKVSVEQMIPDNKHRL